MKLLHEHPIPKNAQQRCTFEVRGKKCDSKGSIRVVYKDEVEVHIYEFCKGHRKEKIMSEAKTMKETDVKAIRNLINQNIDLARGIRECAQALHMPPRDSEATPDSPIGSIVGEEFIELLKTQRRILNDARDALQGFNG